MHAQETDDTDFQTWLDYKIFYHLDNKIQFDGDAGIRGVLSQENWTQAFIRPSVIHQSKDWLQSHGGVGLWFTYDHSIENKFEIRPWQGVKIIWPNPKSLVFSHFIRLEERMTVAPSWDFTLRLRYKIALKSPDWHFKPLANRPFYGFAALELFGNIFGDTAERYVNRNRLTLGLGNHIAPKWRIELEYIRQGSRRGRSEGFRTAEHILRLRFKHPVKSLFAVFD
jgi:hypothetical protein